MAENLDISRGLIVAEAVMMGLAPQIGRQEAHDVVYDACRARQRKGHDAGRCALGGPAGLRAHRPRDDRSPDLPGNYLGLAPQMVDRVLASTKR